MQLHTFKARSLREALRLVRKELGPDASVLHTRDVGSALSRWLGGRTIEVTASLEAVVPSRLPISIETTEQVEPAGRAPFFRNHSSQIPPAELQDFRGRIRAGLVAAAGAEPSLVEQLSGAKRGPGSGRRRGLDRYASASGRRA